MATDERITKINMRQTMFLRLEISDLPDVVGDRVEEGARDVRGLESRERFRVVFL